MGKAREKPQNIFRNSRFAARAQLTLVEHALCPIDAPSGAFTHEAEYYYFKNRSRKVGRAIVDCPRGMKPEDDLYLYGVLGEVFSHAEPNLNLYASASYLLTAFNMSSDGGKNIAQLRETFHRLAAVSYSNAAFYDPIRREHRDVCFHLLSCDIPEANESKRPWRISIDPVFFDYCKSSGGCLVFDRRTYRKLNPSTRRLFLLLHKLFHGGKATTGYFRVDHLCVNQIGFAPGLRAADYNKKIKECAHKLANLEQIILPREGLKALCERRSKGIYEVRFHKGPKMGLETRPQVQNETNNPLYELLKSIEGLNDGCIRNVLRDCHEERIYQWVDATIMAREKKGENGRSYFRRSEAAFFYEGVMSRRHPPNWYYDERRTRDRDRATSKTTVMTQIGVGAAQSSNKTESTEVAFQKWLRGEGKMQFDKTMRTLGNRDSAINQLRRVFENRQESPGIRAIGEIFKRVV